MAQENFLKSWLPVLPKRGFLLLAVPITLSTLCAYFIWKKKRRRMQVSIVENSDQWEIVECQMRGGIDKYMVVGLDCEWTTRREGVGKVALLQLANHNGVCALIRLPKFGNEFPDSLLTLLKDERILKVGVSIHNDAVKLMKDYGIVIRGYLDLAWMASQESGSFSLGLQSLSQRFLGLAISKSVSVRCSNWDEDILTEQQKNYAATDAYVAVQIFSVLLNSRQQFSSSLRFWQTQWWHRRPEVYRWTQVPFKHSGAARNCAKSSAAVSPSKYVPKSAKNSYSIRQRPLYHNCVLQAPDGQPLCTCDDRKIKWYLEKELGDLISESPAVVRLRFEPSGRPHSELDYYLQPKENCCVVCGATHTFIRKNVVPQEYRRYFPESVKAHNCHDIVLLCLSCHKLSDFYDVAFRQRLVVEYDAPLGSAANNKMEENHQLRRVQSAARAVTNEAIPGKRRKELEDIICQYYEVESLTEETLQMALNLQTKFENKGYVPHGLKVATQVMKNDGISQFEKQWRQHFLDVMRPEFMPKSWSVDHGHKDREQ